MAGHSHAFAGGSGRVEEEREHYLRFSFRYLDLRHPLFSVDRRDRRYFLRLLERLRELSALRAGEFTSHRLPTLRIHPIRFGDARLAAKGFDVPGRPDYDAMGWQFSVSANEHGRVHGFLSGNTFYVRWLDPDHRLYSEN
jgi:hypothetical protein